MWLLLAVPVAAQIFDDDDFVRDLPPYDYCFYSIACLCLILFAGCMSGLNVGLMSIDLADLEWKISSGTDRERQAAGKLYSVVKHHHLLLVSILLANAAAMEALPIVFNMMFSELLSIIVSVSFVLFVSEIIPQALLTGPKQLFIASKMLPIVWMVIALSFPISYPISKLLDCCLEAKSVGKFFSTSDLKGMIISKAAAKTDGLQLLSCQQLSMISSVIDLTELKVKSLTQPFDRSKAVDSQWEVSAELIAAVKLCKFKQVPVVNSRTNHISAVLTVQSLLGVRCGVKVEDLELLDAVFIDSDRTLLEALNIFMSSQSELLFVISDSDPNTTGVLTFVALQDFLYRASLSPPEAFEFKISPLPLGFQEATSKENGFSRTPSLMSTAYNDDALVFQ
jgi:metal transporter CNNM